MSFHLFRPRATDMRASGFGVLSHVPCIYNDKWQYQVEASQYLQDRALLALDLESSSVFSIRSKNYPTPKSLATFGANLTNFLEWCEKQGCWRDFQYTEDIVGGYQAQMLNGTWSARNKALSANTTNRRVSEACLFLQWAASRGLRKPFKVISSVRLVSRKSGTSARGQKLKAVQQRAGLVRPDPKKLRLPIDTEILVWLRSVQTKRGSTKALMCELVLKSAIRREEVVQWRVDTLPLDRCSWEVIDEYVTVEVKYGTKGNKYIDSAGELVGPSRFITLPLELAERIAEYREIRRPLSRAKYVRAAESTQKRRELMANPPKQLFLSEFHGQPISAASFYEAWTTSSELPFRGWSPHSGRHYWACKWMLDAIKKRANLSQLTNQNENFRREVIGTATDVLMLEVKPQLGHLSEGTSHIYLSWLWKVLLSTSVSDAYEINLESLLLTKN